MSLCVLLPDKVVINIAISEYHTNIPLFLANDDDDYDDDDYDDDDDDDDIDKSIKQ